MNKAGQFSFNKSSLVSLQAELARKKEEAVSVVRNISQNSSELHIKPHIQHEINLRKNAKIEAKKNDESDISQYCTAIEDKIKKSLLVKTKLYEQLRNKELLCEDENHFLVNFNAESNAIQNEDDEDNSDTESEWVTFVDALGRSRTCLRTDLVYYKQLDSQLQVKERSEEPETQESKVAPISDEVILWNKKKDELRKMWEEEETRLTNKKNIHYQDVLFNEARTHGVGYYSFSHDESERTAQQEALKNLREETEKHQKVSLCVKERRDQMLKQRVEAAKRRKRLRMGLPPDEKEKKESVITDDDDPNPKEKLKAMQKNEPLEQKVDEFLNVMKRSAHVRPWDVGKTGVQAPVLNQHEWNEKQRAKRYAEFAPPTLYNSSDQTYQSSFTNHPFKKHTSQNLSDLHESIPINFECDVENGNCSFQAKQSTKRVEEPPPLSYDNIKEKKPKKCIMEESITAGLNYLKNLKPKKSITLDDRIREDYS